MVEVLTKAMIVAQNCKFKFVNPLIFIVMSVCFAFESQRDYPGTEFRSAVSNLGKKIQVHALRCKTWEIVISPRRFAENGKEMYINKKKHLMRVPNCQRTEIEAFTLTNKA